MKSAKIRDPVKLPGNRTGVVIKVDDSLRRALCVIDLHHLGSGRGAEEWFSFDEMQLLALASPES